jgi:hypothetical protein
VTQWRSHGYATDFSDSSANYPEAIAAYQPVRNALSEAFEGYAFGDPEATAQAILKVVDSPRHHYESHWVVACFHLFVRSHRLNGRLFLKSTISHKIATAENTYEHC